MATTEDALSMVPLVSEWLNFESTQNFGQEDWSPITYATGVRSMQEEPWRN